MSSKTFGLATLFCVVVSPVYALPSLSVTAGGVQSGNWVWDVDVTPDLLLAGGSTPLAVELGFRLTSAPLLSVTNINPSEWDSANPGRKIFGWEPDYINSSNSFGLQANTSTSEIFAAYGSVDFTTPGPKPFLRIVALGPGNGGPLSSTIQWLGAYNLGMGRISQLTGPFTAANYDIFSGTDTQVVPEPASVALMAFGAILIMTGFPARLSRPNRTSALRR